MTYKDIMTAWSQRFAAIFNCMGGQSNPPALLYPLLAISQAQHAAYLTGKEPVPAQVWNAIELFELLPLEKQFTHVAKKLLQGGLPHLATEEIIRLCLGCWEEATGIGLYSKGTEIINGEWSPYNIRRMAKALLEYDPTGLAGVLLIESELDELKKHLQNRAENDTQKHMAMLQLGWLLSLEQIQSVKHQQIDRIKAIVSELRSGRLTKNDEMLLQYFPAEIVLDAHKSFKNYQKFSVQCDEATSKGSVVYARYVYQFKSPEELVTQMQTMPMGFALCVIAGGRTVDAYFVIAVRTANVLHLVSDQPKYEYPLQSEMMSRRNDRFNQFRMDETYLPYELLSIAWADNGRRATGSTNTNLIVSDGLRVIGDIGSRHCSSLTWLSVVFDLCFERYFTNNDLDQPLAFVDYTQVLKLNGNAPEQPADAENLPMVVQSGRYTLQPLRSEDISAELLFEAFPELDKERTANTWMEKQFAPQLDAKMLFIAPGQQGKQLLLGHSASGAGIATYQNVGLMQLKNAELVTQEQARKDALFIARYNQALMIKRLAAEDFTRRKVEVLSWLYKQMAKNLPNLIDKLVAFDHSAVSIAALLNEMKAQKRGLYTERTYREIYLVKTRLPTYLRSEVVPSFESALGLYEDHEYLCYLSEEFDAKYRICLEVSTACDLVLLTGLPLEKLPPELQTFGLTSKSRPGLMLDIADPLETLTNPWDDLKIIYRIPVTLKALNARRKELNLPRILTKDLPVNYWEPEYRTSEQAQKRVMDILNACTAPGSMKVLPSDRHTPDFAYV